MNSSVSTDMLRIHLKKHIFPSKLETLSFADLRISQNFSRAQVRASFVTQNAQRRKQKRKIIAFIAERSVNEKEIGLKLMW